MLDFILCQNGIGVISDSLDALLAHLAKKEPDWAINLTSLAQALGVCFALIIGAYESYMMILGKRGLDVMKLLRIIGFSICISSAGWICKAAKEPGDALENLTKEKSKAMVKQVQAKEEELYELQSKYTDGVLNNAGKNLAAEMQANKENNDSFFGELWDDIKSWGDFISTKIKMAFHSLITIICELLNIVIRFLAGLVFQITFYGLILGRSIFMTILSMFCPVMFAISLAPPFKNAWSQWLSKYISLSLWGFVAYMILFYVAAIMDFSISQDIDAYKNLLANDSSTGEWGEVWELGLKALGTTCFYAMALLMGSYLCKFIPEVASWLVPGGVSSGLGAAAAGVGNSLGMAPVTAPMKAAGGLIAVKAGGAAVGAAARK